MRYLARPNEDGSHFQLLSDHILQTAKLARSASRSLGLGTVSFVSGLLHDLGKYSDEYQDYTLEVGAALRAEKPLPAPRVDHGVYGALYVAKFFDTLLGSCQGPTCIISDRVVSKTVIIRARDLLCMCICYHHGALQDFIPVSRNQEPVLLKRLKKLELSLSEGNRSNWEQVKSRFFQEICTEDQLQAYLFQAILELDTFASHLNEQAFVCHHESMQDDRKGYLPSLQNYAWQMLVRYIYSTLIDADRWDAFIYQTGSQETYNHSIEQHINSYLLNLQKKLEELNSEEPRSPFEARLQQLRMEISDLCSKAASRQTGLYELTVPTGGGKTLSSMRFALEHIKFLEGTLEAKERIIYVLPYTSIIEQNAADVREALDAPFDEILEVHSQVIFHDDDHSSAQDIADKNTLVDEVRYKLLSERYNSPIIFMTQVSFLETLVKSSGQYARRFNHLANSVIIFDEAQTLPLHSTFICNAAINCLVSCFNSTVLMCTATQPPLDKADIPLLYAQNKAIIPSSYKGIDKGLKRVEIVDARKEAGGTLEDGANWLIDKFKSSQSVLVVLNTKKGVKELVNQLCKKQNTFEVFYLTTYLCAAHRRDRIDELKRKLDNGTRLIVVSTNLIECGIHLSFEIVVRNLAGMPSIVQSCGRCNRNAEKELSYGYIVAWDENIRNIENLSKQQACTRSVLRSLFKEDNPIKPDLLSPLVLNTYYQRYFVGDINKQMAYPIQANKGALYDFLGSSQIDVLEYAEKWPFELKTAFKFVSDHYDVIANKGATLVVPYKEAGKSLQAELIGAENLSISDRHRLLKKIQPFTVNMYLNYSSSKDDESPQAKLVRDGLISLPGFDNLFLVKDEYYSENFGVSATSLLDDANIFLEM